MTADPERLADFWAAAMGWTERKSMPDEVLIADAEWNQPRFTFQRVAASPGAPPGGRVHVDLTPTGADRATVVARLVALGASEGATHGDDAFRWTVLRDPDGNEFCVTD